jgi:hypothetical protein
VRVAVLPVLLLLTAAIASRAEPGSTAAEATARALFARYVELSRSFDVGVADLYSDHARIVTHRRYSDGRPDRELEMSGAQWKSLVRRVMGVAKAAGDRDSFSDVRYSTDGARVRIDATRFSESKRYSSPYSALVGPDVDGRWLIFEERTVTQQ